MLFLAAGTVEAQTFSEWFRQKKTQKKYLLQQIAALQVYIGYAQKGYRIAKEGLTTIGGFTKGEFDLHSDFQKLCKGSRHHYPSNTHCRGLQANLRTTWQ